MHDHDFAEICWVEQGSIRHITDGGSDLLHEGSGILVAPHHRHGFQCDDSPASLINCAVPQTTWQRWCQLYQDPIGWATASKPIPFSPPPNSRVAIRELAHSCGNELAVDAWFIPMLHALQPIHADQTPISMPDWIRDAITFAQTYDGLIAGINSFSHSSGRSREHCARSIKRHLGISPRDLVRRFSS